MLRRTFLSIFLQKLLANRKIIPTFAQAFWDNANIYKR